MGEGRGGGEWGRIFIGSRSVLVGWRLATHRNESDLVGRRVAGYSLEVMW